MTRPYMSAPGAGQVRDGLNPRIPLWGLLRGPSVTGFPSFIPARINPIQQSASFENRTIVSQTLPGHQFHDGRVSISVLEAPGNTSIIDIVGTGVGDNPGYNTARSAPCSSARPRRPLTRPPRLSRRLSCGFVGRAAEKCGPRARPDRPPGARRAASWSLSLTALSVSISCSVWAFMKG